MDNTEPMSFCFNTGSKVVSDSMNAVSIVFYDIGGHAITQQVTYQTMKSLSYDIVLVMDWLKSTKTAIGWVACTLDVTVGVK